MKSYVFRPEPILIISNRLIPLRNRLMTRFAVGMPNDISFSPCNSPVGSVTTKLTRGVNLPSPWKSTDFIFCSIRIELQCQVLTFYRFNESGLVCCPVCLSRRIRYCCMAFFDMDLGFVDYLTLDYSLSLFHLHFRPELGRQIFN